MATKQAFGAFPKIAGYFCINSLIAQYSKLPVGISEVKQNPILFLCLVHSQMRKHLDCPLYRVSVGAMWFNMHPNFARCSLLGLPDGFYNALLLVGREGVVNEEDVIK